MKLSQLRHLTAVAEAGTVRQAARNLHLSQSSLTKSIRQLEAALGVELLHRASHGVAPTVAGLALITRAKAVEAELRQARNDIESVKGAAAGEIRVSASPTVAMALLPRAVHAFRRTRPGVTFQIQEGVYPDVLPAVRTGELDFAVCLVTEPPQDEDIQVTTLVKDRLIPAVRANHPLTRQARVALADLLDCDWVAYRRSRTGRDVVAQTFASNGLEPPKRTIECASFACALGLIETGDYVTLVPTQFFAGRPKGLGITPLALKSPMLPWNVAVISRRRHLLSPVCRAFLEELFRVAGAARFKPT